MIRPGGMKPRSEEGIVTRLLCRRLLPVLLALPAAACWDFQPDPPAGPTPLKPGRFATVTIEYRQPQNCANTADHCADRVVFFGSWMAPGDEVLLDTPAGPSFWTGVVNNVPVNWPPTDEPHLVRIFDPHLKESSTGGVTAARLTVGGQAVYFFEDTGTPSESGLIYIDDNGVGHNPF